MKLKKKLMSSGIISAAAIITSIFVPIIPCKKAPGVPNPIYTWKMCSLNPDKIGNIGSITKYFGYTSSLKDAYIILAAISFIAAMAIFHFFLSSKGK